MNNPDRTAPPAIFPFGDFKIKEASSISLGSHANLHCIQAGDQEVIHIEIVFKAGAWFEVMEGQSYFMTQMLKEGTANMNSRQISELFDFYGAYIEIKPGIDHLSLGFYSLTRHFVMLLPVFYSMVFESVFPEKELEIRKSLKCDELKVQEEKIGISASKEFRTAIFGNQHPYGKHITKQEVQDISREVLVEYHQRILKIPFEIILSGAVSNHIIDSVRKQFTSGDSPYHQLNNLAFSVNNRGNFIEDRQDSLQSAIRVGKVLFNKTHPDYHRMLVVNEILGGYFGSRLMSNIRENKGYTYGIHSALVSFQNAGYLVIGTEVKKEFAQATLDEINLELNRLITEPVDNIELETVKNYMIGTFRSSINSPFALASKFKSIYLYGLNYDYYDRFLETIRKVSAEEIQQLSKKYLDVSSFTTVKVG